MPRLASLRFDRDPTHATSQMPAMGPHSDHVSFRKRWAAAAARTRVGVCMVLAFASCWYAQPVEQSLLRGISIALVGLAIRAWAAGHLRKNESLTVSGPYAFVRNPLYIGSLLAGVGSGIATNQPVLLVTVISVFLLWFLPVVGEEEDHIRKILPGYSEYEARVPRFLPALVPGYASSERFDARLYMRNREYSALGGLLVFATILWIKL